MGLIIGQEPTKGKDLSPISYDEVGSPMPSRDAASRPGGMGKPPPGRLTEVRGLARMPLSGGLVSAVLQHL
jgi:hypothetical protein